MVLSPASRTAPALALGAVLMLAGCSADADGSTEKDDTATASPLEEYFGSVGESDPAAMAAEQTEVENFTSTCMSEAGFEYIPRQIDESEYDWATGDMADRDTKEWVAKNGYGMTMVDEPEVVEEMPADPNMDYVESLSPGAQTAYYEALNGPDIWSTMTEEEMANHEYKWEEAGCQGAADHEVRNASDLYSAPEHADLFEAMENLWTTTTADPRTAELDAAWSDCMADAGYTDFTTPQEAVDTIMEASNALWENIEYDEEDPEAAVGPSDEALAEVREVELATATADFTCKEETSYQKESAKIQIELEEQFIKDHKAELEAFRAAIEKSETE